MSRIFYDIERSFAEYVNSNLSTQSGEVLVYEFPTSELGSHTFALEYINHTPYQVSGRAIDGGSSGRIVESLVQADIFRLPTSSGEPDPSGGKKMLSRFDDMFKTNHFVPFKTYGTNPSATTTGTVCGAIKIDEQEVATQVFDPNPNIRRFSFALKLTVKEVF